MLCTLAVPEVWGRYTQFAVVDQWFHGFGAHTYEDLSRTSGKSKINDGIIQPLFCFPSFAIAFRVI
jgi:hypothetical protein